MQAETLRSSCSQPRSVGHSRIERFMCHFRGVLRDGNQSGIGQSLQHLAGCVGFRRAEDQLFKRSAATHIACAGLVPQFSQAEEDPARNDLLIRR